MSDVDQSATQLPGQRVVLVVLLAAVAWMCGQAAVQVDFAQGTDYERGNHWLLIDINSATAAEMSLLPGVGPRLAERIIQHRETHGPFGSLEELQHVHGIGPRTVQRARPFAIAAREEVRIAGTAR